VAAIDGCFYLQSASVQTRQEVDSAIANAAKNITERQIDIKALNEQSALHFACVVQ
jgi:hypothetical protein